MFEAELVGSEPEVATPSAPETQTQETTPAGGEESTTETAPVTETTTEETTPTTETTAAVLYDLPDGRKVDAETLQREWKENFYPEYTRKSQELSELKRGKNPDITKDDVPEWQKPDYVPKTYGELIQIAEQRALERIREEAGAEEQARAQVASQVDATIAEIKAVDPKLDENALFQHANKYKFTDLRAAWENMSEMRKVAMTVEQTTLKNVNQRKADPVAGGGAPALPTGDAVPYGTTGQYGSALEYMRHLKN